MSALEDKPGSLPAGAGPAPRPDVTDTGGGSGVGPEPSGGRSSVWALGTQFSSYEIESLLASGGMAEVWRAKIKGLEGFEKRIVIKTMLTQYQDRADLVEMFVSEASLAARLSHPNIVDVIDFGQLEGRYFIAMEYVPGMTLRFAHKRMRARGRRLPVSAVLHVARDVCEALQYMHDLEDAGGEMGLVHRDLSPENLIVSTSGTTKLIDFGTARATARMPPSTIFVGKFRYAAPERIRQDGEDHRSDLYSLGVILYECLVGVRPFEGSDAEVIKAVKSSVACDPLAVSADVPPAVADLVRKATAANPAHRFESAQAMGTALARCLAALDAVNKEREVTGALATMLDEPSGQAAFEASIETLPETIPEPTGAAEESSGSGAIALSEMEIIEASGPIRNLVGAVQPIHPTLAADTRKISVPLPPEAFPPPRSEAVRARATTQEMTQSDRAVALFDQGLALRLEGRYEEAQEAWELALRLAPQNHLYQAQVSKFRAQLESRRRPR